MEQDIKGEHRLTIERGIFLVGLFLSVCCLLAGIYVRCRYRLTEPVFVDSGGILRPEQAGTKEEPFWNVEMTFYYITGNGDNRRLREVTFPDLAPEGGKPPVLLECRDEVLEDSQYELHTVSGRMELPFKEDGEEEDTFRRLHAAVFWSDGSQTEETLGAFLWEPFFSEESEERLFEWVSSGGSSDGHSEEVRRASSDLTLRYIGTADPMGRPYFAITVNGQTLDEIQEAGGIRLCAGDLVTIESQWTGGNDAPTPLPSLSVPFLFEAEPSEESGESEPVIFSADYTYQRGNRFVRIWNYLRQKGVF